MKNEMIRQVPLFASLPDSEIEYLAEALSPCEVSENSLILHEGEEEGHYYILVDGEVDIIKALGTSDERLLAVREAGSFLGEMSLFSPDGRHTASVRARTPLQLLEMTRSDLDALLQRQPTLAYEMIRTLSLRLDESENLTIRDLRRKNRELIKAYKELEAAQAQIIEKEKLERELEVARGIQMSILPRKLPELACFDFGAQVVPMSAVGGDFYDFIALDGNTLGIAVGDVADHGVPAALFMALTVTLLRAGAHRADSPGELLRNVNRHLLEMNDTGLFVTMLYGVLDCTSREFRFARAGHQLPIVTKADGKAIDMKYDVGHPLGLIEDPKFDEQSMTLPTESLLLMYSDGASDATDMDGRSFGLEGMLTEMRSSFSSSAQGICDRIWESLEAFRGDTDQHDDVTLLVVKVE